MDSIKQFSIEGSFDYQALLDEAIETILDAEKELGPLEKGPDGSAAAQAAPLRKLKEAQAFFAPRLTVRPLRKKEFARRHLTPAETIKPWLNSHNFYLAQIPVTLRPSQGWLFTRLECWVGFDNPAVKIHSICPANAWVDVLQAQTSLSLGLDETLSFAAHLALPPAALAYENLNASGQAALGAGVEATGGARLVLGPFSYQVWRPQTLAVGRENAEAFWSLDGDDRVQRQEPYLALVLRVPKKVTTLAASGELIAYHDYNRLGADHKDWWKRMRLKVQAFLQGGIPFENRMRWENILAEPA